MTSSLLTRRPTTLRRTFPRRRDLNTMNERSRDRRDDLEEADDERNAVPQYRRPTRSGQRAGRGFLDAVAARQRAAELRARLDHDRRRGRYQDREHRRAGGARRVRPRRWNGAGDRGGDPESWGRWDQC